MYNKIKRKIVLVPSAYKSSVLGDILPLAYYYKDIFDVYILSDLYKDDCKCENGINYVNHKSKFSKYLIYTSDYIFDAGSLNASTKVSKHQKRISVWHGIPYKRMFVDYDEKHYQEALNYAYGYDLMISPSKFYSEKFLRNSMLYNGEILEATMPRLENIISNNNVEHITSLKKKLGLPLDKKIMLYAPTLRESKSFNIPCNFEEINKILGDDWIVIAKAHYMNSLKSIAGITKDFTSYSEVNDLLLLSDVLVTDYSSLMFDYSILNKKLILFQYDFEEYSSERGFMFDIKEYINSEDIAYSEEEFISICKKLSLSDLKSNTLTMANNFYEYREENGVSKLASKLNLNSEGFDNKEITFLINELNEIGGIHNFISNLCVQFKKHLNCKVNVIAIKDSNNRNEKFVKFDTDNIFDIKLSSELTKDAATSIISQTNGVIISCQFSAHVHFQHLFKDKNVVAMFHGDIKDVVGRTLYKWHLDAINNRNINNYKRFVVLTENNKKLLSEYVKDDSIKNTIDYIGNSIDFSNSKKLFNNSNVYVSVTRLDNDKNVFDIIKLFENKLLSPDIKVEVYGDGPLSFKFEEEVKSKGLEDRIILKGYCSSKEEIYRDKQGLISISKSEGFPLILLEAAKYYIPVILFDSYTAASEIAIDIGKLIDVDDFDEFARTLNSPLIISDKVFEDFHDNHSNETIVNKWFKLIQSLETNSYSVQNNNVLKQKYKFLRSKVINLKQEVLKVAIKKIKNKHRRRVVELKQKQNFYRRKMNRINEPLVSLIIPYYYSSKTIDETLKSIENLKYKNVEAIIVNDGSDEYTPPNKANIRYYKLEKNIGLGGVRNFGVDKATGKYIAFLDSDDTLNKYGLSFLVNYAEKNNLSVVSGITRRIDLNTDVSHIWFKNIYNRTYTNKREHRHILLNDALSTNKIYNLDDYKEKGMRFESGLYEDKLFTARLYSKYDEIGIVNNDYYVWMYYGDSTSISTTLSIDNFNERVSRVNEILNIVDDANKVKYISFLISHDFRIYINQFLNYSESEQKYLFQQMQEMLFKWKEFLYIEYIARVDNYAYATALLDDDYDRFIKISSFIATMQMKGNE